MRRSLLTRRRPRSELGITMLDVLVAVGLLSVGGTGLLAVELSVVRASVRSREISEATSMAREEMEQLTYSIAPMPGGNDTVDAYGCSSTRVCVQRGTIYTRVWTVGAGSPVSLQVTASFLDPAGVQHSVVLNGQR